MKQTKCYIYTRVSTAIQVEGFSLDAQKDRIIRYADGNGFKIVGEYCDAGKSGKNMTGRPQFKQMLDDIESGKDDVDFVLVFKLSRFGRNAADVLTSLQFMQTYGVNLICVDDSIDSSKDSGKLMISVLSAVAEIERENIRVQTMEGRLQKAREGKWNGGFAPYGYELIKGELYVVEDEAEIIRLIFKQFITTNMGINGVANWLNNQGYKKNLRQNNKIEGFTTHFVKGVLDNPVYYGMIAFGRRKTEKIKGTVNETHIVKSDDYILQKGIHEAIITEEEWNVARAKRERTGHRNEKTHALDHAHILSGLIKCPVCGAGLTANFSRKHSKDKYERFYYHCKHFRFLSDGRKCDYKKNWVQEDVNAAVEKVICSLVTNPDFEKAMKSEIGENLDIANLENEIKNLRTLLRRKESNKSTLIAQIDNLNPDDPYYKKKQDDMNIRLDSFYEDIEALEYQIAETETRLENIQQQRINGETVYNYLIFFEKYYSQFSEAEKKEFMNVLIEKIEIFEDVQENGQFLKSITFRFPIYFNSGYVRELRLTEKSTFETVCLLSKLNTKHHIEIDLTDAEKKATYQEIKDYVLEHSGLKISTLNIAQIKQKCGIIDRDCYNKPKSDDARQPQCPPNKEKAIKEALKHFGMIK